VRRVRCLEQHRQFSLGGQSSASFAAPRTLGALRDPRPIGVGYLIEAPVVRQHHRGRSLAPPGQSGKPWQSRRKGEPVGDGLGARRTSPRPRSSVRVSLRRSAAPRGRRRRIGPGPVGVQMKTRFTSGSFAATAAATPWRHRLELHHGPDDHAQRLQRLEDLELGAQRRINALAVLVPGHIVAERIDDNDPWHPDVGGAVGHMLTPRSTTRRSDLLRLGVRGG